MSANPLTRHPIQIGPRSDEDRIEIGHRVAATYNARLASEERDKGIRWIYDELADSLKLVPLAEYRRMGVR